ncbi:Glycoside hydrolase, family 28 [Dillenia turbinata]|uniref:Glycoside hydrolase, family 28 n=1 Tax=Dillenia turbinata TaxID=194707 RepID=A0AAN8VDP7_9MAGN
MKLRSTALALFVLLASTTLIHAKDFNVNNYGARADGKTDNSKVLLKVWKEACEEKGSNTIYIPAGEFMTSIVEFRGPCKGYIVFKIDGVLKAPSDPQLGKSIWVVFKGIDGLTVTGNGRFDGQGPLAWRYNDCKKNKQCKDLPNTLSFRNVNNAWVNNIKLVDSKGGQLSINGCNNVHFENIEIKAPEDSPNTDGVRISASNHISFLRSVIGTGDDCFALNGGSRNINITQVFCGPGHGISIGSLGRVQDNEDVTNVVVQNCTLKGTNNGVRIKTWATSYTGIASDFTFENIQMINVNNPIIIDQKYCPNNACVKASSSIQVSNVKYKNIRGISSSQVAVSFLCSETKPCQKLELTDINLQYNGKGPVKTECSYANGVAFGTQKPASCFH